MAQEPEVDESYHRPVLAEEVVALMRPIERGVVVDATFGGGGHSRRLLETMSKEVTVIGIDRDPAARARGEAIGCRVLAGSFGDFAELLAREGITQIGGALFDFGVSSHQLDEPTRGFSYRHAGPLDMRMNPDAGRTAAEIVNESSETELVRILRTLGEETHATRIARAIVGKRPFTSTIELAEAVAAAVPAAARSKGHPARKTFQALRIAVNDELAEIESGLDSALDLLEPGGRVVTIAYHSLEDRIAKRRFASATAGCTCPPGLPVCGCAAEVEFQLLTRKAVKPAAAEIAANPRARSARLRAIRKVAA